MSRPLNSYPGQNDDDFIRDRPLVRSTKRRRPNHSLEDIGPRPLHELECIRGPASITNANPYVAAIVEDDWIPTLEDIATKIRNANVSGIALGREMGPERLVEMSEIANHAKLELGKLNTELSKYIKSDGTVQHITARPGEVNKAIRLAYEHASYATANPNLYIDFMGERDVHARLFDIRDIQLHSRAACLELEAFIAKLGRYKAALERMVSEGPQIVNPRPRPRKRGPPKIPRGKRPHLPRVSPRDRDDPPNDSPPPSPPGPSMRAAADVPGSHPNGNHGPVHPTFGMESPRSVPEYSPDRRRSLSRSPIHPTLGRRATHSITGIVPKLPLSHRYGSDPLFPTGPYTRYSVPRMSPLARSASAGERKPDLGVIDLTNIDDDTQPGDWPNWPARRSASVLLEPKQEHETIVILDDDYDAFDADDDVEFLGMETVNHSGDDNNTLFVIKTDYNDDDNSGDNGRSGINTTSGQHGMADDSYHEMNQENDHTDLGGGFPGNADYQDGNVVQANVNNQDEDDHLELGD